VKKRQIFDSGQITYFCTCFLKIPATKIYKQLLGCVFETHYFLDARKAFKYFILKDVILLSPA